MAFENVNVDSLRNAIISCRNSIDYKSSKELLSGELANNNIWQASSKANLTSAITKLINVRHNDLEKKLDSYLLVVNDIAEYKKLDSENIQLKIQLDKLKNTLNAIEDPVPIQREMDRLNNMIMTNESKMQRLETKVASAI